MALIVEDGTGLPNANSYVSVADADSYHVDRGNAAWAAAASSDRETALIRATAYLEARYVWVSGFKALGGEDQSLSWPRYEAIDRDGYAIDVNVIPRPVVQSTCELALRALTGTLMADQERGVLSEGVGPLNVTYDPQSPQEKRFLFVDRLLQGLARPIGSSVGFWDLERG